jgi:hypothetical protein
MHDPDRQRMKNLLHFLGTLGEGGFMVREIARSHRLISFLGRVSRTESKSDLPDNNLVRQLFLFSLKSL